MTLNNNHQKNISLEFGDVLFALVNVARLAGVHPETALTDALTKFEKRYKKLEAIALQGDIKIDAMSSDELNRLWCIAKKEVV